MNIPSIGRGAVHSAPSKRQIRAGHLTGFSKLVQTLGGKPDTLLERHGLHLSDIESPDFYVDRKAVVDTLEYCSSFFNDQLFGFKLAELQEPEIYGCVAAICRSASSLRQTLECKSRYLPVVHTPDSLSEVVEVRDVAEYRWSVNSDTFQNKQAHFQAAAINIKFMSHALGERFQPKYVNLAADIRRKDVVQIESWLRCPVHTNVGPNAIGFASQLLERPVRTSNKLVYELLTGYLDPFIHGSQKTITDQVEAYINVSLQTGICSIDHCAVQLGFQSFRTLQERLRIEGTNFSHLLESQRLELAKGYLERNELALESIAALLGYSEQAAFGRAFKRWTGFTPNHYKRHFINGAQVLH